MARDRDRRRTIAARRRWRAMSSRHGRIPVALRFDDPSPCSDHALERAIIELLQRHQACATVAVVPFRRTAAGTVELRPNLLPHLESAAREGVIEIALHGCFHARHDKCAPDRPSEFSGLTLAEQRALVQTGLQRLQQVFPGPVPGFVPPWNSFDAATMRVANELGFGYLSAGWEIPADADIDLPLLIPRTCHLNTLQSAVAQARKYRQLSPAVVAVFHPHDFRETGDPEAFIGLSGFAALLQWIREQDDLEPVTLDQLSRRLEARKVLAAMRTAGRAGGRTSSSTPARWAASWRRWSAPACAVCAARARDARREPGPVHSAGVESTSRASSATVLASTICSIGISLSKRATRASRTRMWPSESHLGMPPGPVSSLRSS
jgi:peptidoglycan/xylan/chitin deacetylase (PgdA/CDA1 family)